MIEKNISQKNLEFEKEMSEECVDVLSAMLQRDPNKRPTASQLFAYKIFKDQGLDQHT